MKKSPVTQRTRKTPGGPSAPYRQLDTLLHTVRCIAQYEDALCELSHEVRQSGLLSEDAKLVLDGILKKIPSQEYVHDLDAVTVLLAGSKQLPSRTLNSKAVSAPARKRAAVAKKAGRTSSK